MADTVQGLAEGTTASFEKQVSAEDVAQFAQVTGDTQPLHTDPDFAARTRFRQPIAHGMLVLADPRLRARIDLAAFVDAPADIRLARRLRRDTTERGLDHQTVAYQWHHHVYPAYKRFLLPYMDEADIIVIVTRWREFERLPSGSAVCSVPLTAGDVGRSFAP
jgi:hypothetical protein